MAAQEFVGQLQQRGWFSSIAIAATGATLLLAMHSFRHGSIAKRAGLGAIVFFALLLQTFVAAAVPIAAFDSPARITCSDDGLQPNMPRGEHRHCHGFCCILGCAACNDASIATASGVAIVRTPIASVIVWSVTPAIATCPLLKFYFGARGPPQII